MDETPLTIDQREQRIAAVELVIGQMRSLQIEDLAELDRAQIATADGSRSLSEWVSSRMDLGPETAKSLVQTMRRLHDHPNLRDALASGEVSFDRTEALSRIIADVGLMEHLDVAGVRREAAKRAQISAADEYRTAADRFVVLQPSLDESWWKLFGGLDGASGAVVDKVLTELADQLPALPDGTPWYWCLAPGNRPGRTGRHRQSATSPNQRLRRHRTCSRQQRASRNHSRSRTPHRPPSPRSHPLRRHHRDHRQQPRRYPDELRTPLPDHPPRTPPGNPPPRQQRLRRRRMQKSSPAPNPPHHPLEPGRRNQPRQPGNTLLVPPPRRRPRTRLSDLPPPAKRADPIPPTPTKTTRPNLGVDLPHHPDPHPQHPETSPTQHPTTQAESALAPRTRSDQPLDPVRHTWGMIITRLGHAAILLETPDARVLVDPGFYSSGWHGLTDLTAVLVTHQHHDHIDVENVGPLLDANPGARVIAEPAVVDMLGDRVVAPAVVGERAKIGDLDVEMVGGEHAVIHEHFPRIGNVGLVFQEGDGPRIFHPGDSFATAPDGIDLLALPLAAPWATVGMTIDFAIAVGPDRILPIHDATLSQSGRPTYLRMCRTVIDDSIALDDPAIGDRYQV